jgi:hypothetical protein
MFSTSKHSRSVFVFFIEVIVNQMNYIKLSIFPKLLVQLEPKLIGVEPLLRQRLRTKKKIKFVYFGGSYSKRKKTSQTDTESETYAQLPPGKSKKKQ